MKKAIIPILVALLLLLALPFGLSTNAENDSNSEIPDSTAITYGYLRDVFKEQLKKEIIAELTASGGITIETPYNDISATKGQLILLSPDSELIYRGGGAVVVTATMSEGEGIKDMSAGRELFSGNPLEYGHIYFCSSDQQKHAVLITGDTAYFTIRGGYEIK